MDRIKDVSVINKRGGELLRMPSGDGVTTFRPPIFLLPRHIHRLLLRPRPRLAAAMPAHYRLDCCRQGWEATQ